MVNTVSKLDVEGKLFDSRIQGGLLSDGIGGILSGLATITPVATYAQNNGKLLITILYQDRVYLRKSILTKLYRRCNRKLYSMKHTAVKFPVGGILTKTRIIGSHSMRKPESRLCMLVDPFIVMVPFQL